MSIFQRQIALYSLVGDDDDDDDVTINFTSIYIYRPYIYTGIAASIGHVQSLEIYAGIAASVGLVKSQLVRPSQMVSNKKISPKHSSKMSQTSRSDICTVYSVSAHFNLNFPGSTGLF